MAKKNGYDRRKNQCQPAAGIVYRLGGAKVISEALGISKAAPYRWALAREMGGTGGKIPYWYEGKLKELARRRKVKLTARDFDLIA